MDYEIIDFHTHPFPNDAYNICKHTESCNTSFENTIRTMKNLGVGKICGSVIGTARLKENETWWDKVREYNDVALALKEACGDFYVPGFHIHPDFVQESMAEIDAMAEKGVRLIGELVPYVMGYKNYDNPNLHKLMDYATEKGMLVNIHTPPNTDDDIDAFVSAHPNTTIIAAHPGEYSTLLRHIERMKKHENYYIDLSGTGIHRHGAVKRIIDEVGVERILYGSDFPVCNPAAYVGSVLLDDLLTPQQKRAIFSENAKRLLGI